MSVHVEQMTTLEKKIGHFSRILSNRPGDELTILALAEASFRRGLKLEALTAYQEVVGGRPVPEAHLAVAEIYSAQGMPNEAYGELRRLFELDPHNVEARLLVNALQGEALPPEDVRAIMERPTTEEAFDEARLRLKIQRAIYNRELQERTRNVTLEPGTVIHEYHMEEAKKKLIRVDELLRELERFREYNQTLSHEPPRPEPVSAQESESLQASGLEPPPVLDELPAELAQALETGVEPALAEAPAEEPGVPSTEAHTPSGELLAVAAPAPEPPTASESAPEMPEPAPAPGGEPSTSSSEPEPQPAVETVAQTQEPPMLVATAAAAETVGITAEPAEPVSALEPASAPETVSAPEPVSDPELVSAPEPVSAPFDPAPELAPPGPTTAPEPLATTPGIETAPPPAPTASEPEPHPAAAPIAPVAASEPIPQPVPEPTAAAEEPAPAPLPTAEPVSGESYLDPADLPTQRLELPSDPEEPGLPSAEREPAPHLDMGPLPIAAMEPPVQSSFASDFGLSMDSPVDPDLPDLSAELPSEEEFAPAAMPSAETSPTPAPEPAPPEPAPSLEISAPTFNDAPAVPEPVAPVGSFTTLPMVDDDATMILTAPEPELPSSPPVETPAPEPPVFSSAEVEAPAGLSPARKAFYETHAESLSSLTTTLARTRGVTSIFLVAREGVTIDAVAKDNITEKRVGELVKESFEFLEAFANAPAYWVLECAGGIFVMQRLDDRHVLIAIGQAGANFGALRYTMDKTRTKFEQLLAQAPQ